MARLTTSCQALIGLLIKLYMVVLYTILLNFTEFF